MQEININRRSVQSKTQILGRVLWTSVWAAAAFFTSFLKPGGVASPFPAALIGALPMRYAAAAVAGGVAGALVELADGGTAVLLLTSLLMLAVRLICEQYGKLLWVLLPTAAFAAVCLSGGQQSDAAAWLTVVSAVYYGVFCLGIYFLLRPLGGASDDLHRLMTQPRVRFSATVLLFAALGAGSAVTLAGMSVFTALGVLVLICFTRQTPPLFAAACGLAAGLLLGVSRGLPELAAALAMGCLAMASVPQENNLRLTGFSAAVTVILFSFSTDIGALTCYYEIMLAVLLAACLPQAAFARLGMAAEPSQPAVARNHRDAFALSETLQQLRGDFSEVCGRLDGLKLHADAPDKVAEQICGGCRCKNRCYNVDFDRTLSWLFSVSEAARSGRPVPPSPYSYCERSAQLGELFRSYYGDAPAPSPAGMLARRTVREQLALMADIALVAAQLGEEGGRDVRLEEFATERLKRMGIRVVSCEAVSDSGRVQVNVTVRYRLKAEECRQLRTMIADYCGARMAEPSQKVCSEGYRITCRSVPRIELMYGFAQRASKPDDCCGDCMAQFETYDGKQLFVLCDGMGTGGDAAVDGNMAAAFFGQLCANGATPDIAIRTANSVLSVRADTESLSTLDAVLIDVYRARARLIKAGAFTTLLLRNGSVMRFEGGALPIGIIDKPDYQERDIKLNRGDILLLASDGVADEDWLAVQLQNHADRSPARFCEGVVEEARSRQSRPDDITVAMIAVR